MSDTRDVALYIILFCTVASYFEGCGTRAKIDRIEERIKQIEQDNEFPPIAMIGVNKC